MGKKIRFVIDKDEDLIRALKTAAPGLSRANAARLVKSGEVRINGEKIKSAATAERGAEITAFLPDSMYSAPKIPVVYEDENIVVFDKPKHIAFDAIPPLVDNSLIAVHRLDTNTTGLIAFAKNTDCADALTAAFAERRSKKIYDAVVSPPPPISRATLTAYTAMFGGVASVSATPKPGFKTMITEYETVSRVGSAAVLRVYPHTGRTHQIRAHLNFIGSPIVGDPKYGNVKIKGAPNTQMLSAVSLSFDGLTGDMSYLNGREFKTDSNFDLAFLSDL